MSLTTTTSTNSTSTQQMCIECEDMPASVKCHVCVDCFCAPCYRWIHRKGKRQAHDVIVLHKNDASMDALRREDVEGTTEHFLKLLEAKQRQLSAAAGQQTLSSTSSSSSSSTPLSTTTTTTNNDSPLLGMSSDQIGTSVSLSDVMGDDDDLNDVFDGSIANERKALQTAATDQSSSDSSASDSSDSDGTGYIDKSSGSDDDGLFDDFKAKRRKKRKRLRKKRDRKKKEAALAAASSVLGAEPSNNKQLDRLRFVPLRLSSQERVLLQLCEKAMEVSEYTDKVDVANDYFGWRVGPKDQVILSEIEDVLSILCGLFASNNFRGGQRFIKGKSFKDNEDFFARVFEVARRFKIVNPDKMRTTYGKLMHLLQDAVTTNIVNIVCKLPVKTVFQLLVDKKAVVLIGDKDLITATQSVDDEHRKSREQLQAQNRAKAEARTRLIEKYSSCASPILDRESLERVIDSIGDANTYISQNRKPVDRMIEYLDKYFDPEHEEKESSLAIHWGYGGSKLSHAHGTQYTFVMQSLSLWREIQHEMFKLWIMADRDLLNERSPYRLRNTGQGLNRVQAAPNVSRAMSEILGRVQHKVRSRYGGWVGLSVVHLGDRDVPNALVFIDKYTQVPRILAPIVNVVESIHSMAASDKNIANYLQNTFGGAENAKRVILRDYYRHGFDGSGDDGGSCIDGRLTSSWNWCSKLSKKPYHTLFMLAGFQGFDGSFK